jgi:adenylate kinase family enzyme
MNIKIRIIGGAGSGKSYIAKAISNKLGSESYDLDNIFWDNQANQYGVKTPNDIRDEKLEEIIAKNSWIIEGVYYKWAYKSFEKADIIFILKPNVYLQHWRVIFRYIKRKLGLIKSIKKETLKGLIDLIKWNHGYNKRFILELREFIKKFEDKTIILKHNNDVFNYLEKH